MKTKRLKRPAFTLVELLVVVAIIGILATLTAVAATAAIRSARRGTIASNMTNVIMALESYRGEFGEYPPDMLDDDALVRHVRKRWPRFVMAGANTADRATNIRKAVTNVYKNVNTNIDFTDKNRACVGALALWLGGFPDSDGIFSGFNADPVAPFGYDGTNPNDGSGTAATVNTFDKKLFIELTSDKEVVLVDFNGPKVPCIAFKTGTSVYPFIYFTGSSEGGNAAYFHENDITKNVKAVSFNACTDSDWKALGYAYPYAEKSDDTSNTTKDDIRWYEPRKFQILHPGLDGNFGSNSFRSLDDSAAKFVKQADFDNITNVSGNAELKTIMP